MSFSTRLLRLGAALATASLLSGCVATVPMTAAPHAREVACANVSVHLPDELGGSTDANGNLNSVPLARRTTDAQATAAWGSPAAVLLWCGAEPLGPTTLPCVTVNDVDWIVDERKAPNYTFTTFGRTPVVQVVVDSRRASGSTVLADLSSAIATTARTDACLG